MKPNQIQAHSNFSPRLHPLVTVAAASVIVLSLLGAAAITGVIPSSRANEAVELAGKAPTHVKNTSAVATSNPPATATGVAQQPVAAKQNSPVGIGIGAVVGGVLGSQVGSGDGKTLATIAGAVGGGYVGNEIAKKNQ
jgi:uncharacterized protein YcfJ